MSEAKPKLVIIKIVVDGVEVSTQTVLPKQFKTGSFGYYGNFKVALGDDDGVGYQAQVQLIKIGSKDSGKTQA
jgi:hypothetical protein